MKVENILIDNIIPATITIPLKYNKALIMLHGTGSDKNEVNNSYLILSNILCKEYNILSVRIDFRGSGGSKESYRDYNIDTAVEDAVNTYNYIKNRFVIEDISIIGFSQGGTIASIICGLYPNLFKSLITLSGALNIFPSTTFTNEMYLEARKNGYCKLNFGFRDSLDLDVKWFETIKNIDILKGLEKYLNKILVIQGENDEIVMVDDARKIFSTTKNDLSKLILLKNCDHIFNVLKEEDLKTLKLVSKEVGKFLD